jgi:hypothetical protein
LRAFHVEDARLAYEWVRRVFSEHRPPVEASSAARNRELESGDSRGSLERVPTSEVDSYRALEQNMLSATLRPLKRVAKAAPEYTFYSAAPSDS